MNDMPLSEAERLEEMLSASGDGGRELLYMDPDYCGSCPCATIDLWGTTLEMHCWRVCQKCERCGVHYEGNREVAEVAKKYLDQMNWFGEWNIVEGLRDV
jgi:hypothetical protein